MATRHLVPVGFDAQIASAQEPEGCPRVAAGAVDRVFAEGSCNAGISATAGTPAHCALGALRLFLGAQDGRPPRPSSCASWLVFRAPLRRAELLHAAPPHIPARETVKPNPASLQDRAAQGADSVLPARNPGPIMFGSGLCGRAPARQPSYANAHRSPSQPHLSMPSPVRARELLVPFTPRDRTRRSRVIVGVAVDRHESAGWIGTH